MATGQLGLWSLTVSLSVCLSVCLSLSAYLCHSLSVSLVSAQESKGVGDLIVARREDNSKFLKKGLSAKNSTSFGPGNSPGKTSYNRIDVADAAQRIEPLF